MESLENTENAWVIDLLKAFNYGDIKLFEKMRPTWSKIPDLAAQEAKLREKINILCLMEMTFVRTANNRSITFAEIAREAFIPINDVELLVMKALSQGLVRGAIDQVGQTVNMTWVQPRVLTKDQVSQIAENMNQWSRSITKMERLMESKAGEILTN